MAITALPTPPSRSNPTNFAAAGDAFMAALPQFVSDANALAANLNSIAAGGAYAIPYTFSTTTTDTDPGAGYLRLDNATQNLATTIRMEVVGAGGSNWQSVIDTFDASTNAVKGAIRIFKQGDATKWLTFNVTARTALTGYRDIAVTCTGSSSANPFVNGDSVMLHFQRAGDQGIQGTPGLSGFSNMVVLRSTQAWTAPAGATKGRITVIDGGNSGLLNQSTPWSGKGGSASVSIRTLTPGVSYTATVGAGGSAGTQNQAGGASSFAGTGFTTLTSTNGDLNVVGGLQGDTLYATTNMTTNATNGTAPGQGGGSTANTTGGVGAGAAGAIIVEY